MTGVGSSAGRARTTNVFAQVWIGAGHQGRGFDRARQCTIRIEQCCSCLWTSADAFAPLAPHSIHFTESSLMSTTRLRTLRLADVVGDPVSVTPQRTPRIVCGSDLIGAPETLFLEVQIWRQTVRKRTITLLQSVHSSPKCPTRSLPAGPTGVRRRRSSLRCATLRAASPSPCEAQ